MVVVPLKYPTFHYLCPNVEGAGILLTFFLDLHPTFGSTFPEFPKCKRMRCHCPESQRTPLVSIRHQLGLLFLFALDVFPFYTFPFFSSLLFSFPFVFILFLLFALLCFAYLSFLFLSRTKGDDGGSTPQIPNFSLQRPKCGMYWNFTYFFRGPPSDLWIHLSRVPQVQSHALSLSWVPKDTAGLDPPSTWSSFSLCLRRFPFLHLSFLFFSSLFLSFRFHSFPFVCFALFCLSFLSFPFKNQGRRWW